MSRILNLHAPKSMSLHTMRTEEIEQYVSKLADQALERGLEGGRPIGVNAVAIGQLVPLGGQDVGGWAEWTRACCNRRDLIDDFTDPAINEFEREGSPLVQQLAGQHVESQMRIVTLESPQHRGG